MTADNTKILIAVKDKSIRKQLKNIFLETDYNTIWLDKLDRILKYFEKDTYDLLLISGAVCKDKSLDYRDFLTVISKESPQTQIILLVKENDIGIAVDAMDAGGDQYIRMPAKLDELKLMIELALNKKPEFGRNKLLAENESVYRFGKFIGGSPAIQTVYRQIQQVAPTNIPVLLLGETGTGKDLAAQAIHSLSNKEDGPYVPVNLGSLPSELVASELFGHEKGAFTGAFKQQKGVFETASEGTVFLDEIESIGHKVQTSLLRIVEQKKFNRLGGRRAIRTNARLIAASNENLDDLVAHGRFREDLYYRLDVFRITLPPLRERTSDIPLIAEEYIAKFSQELNKNIIRINPNCMNTLEDYDWPGNVRELINIIQRAVLICDSEEINESHLPLRLQQEKTDPARLSVEIGTSLNNVEKQLIQKTLSHTQNNRKKAAELLGITRRALYNKLSKHNIR